MESVRRANGADPVRVSEGADYLGVCDSASGPNAGGPPQAVVAHEDITDRRRHEEERARRRLREAATRARADEQREIGRELHDRVAHTMVLVHQSLQLRESLREHDPKKAAEKLELAKRMVAEAIE